MPWYLRLLTFILYPMAYIRSFTSSIKVEYATDTIEVYGQRFTREFFQGLGKNGLEDKTLFRFCRSKDNTIGIEVVRDA